MPCFCLWAPELVCWCLYVRASSFSRTSSCLLISCFCSCIHYRFHSPFLSHFHSHFHSRFHSRFYSRWINFLCSLFRHKGNKTNWHFRSSTRKLKTPRFEQLQTHVPNLMASRGVKIKAFWKKNWIQLELNYKQEPHTISHAFRLLAMRLFWRVI